MSGDMLDVEKVVLAIVLYESKDCISDTIDSM